MDQTSREKQENGVGGQPAEHDDMGFYESNPYPSSAGGPLACSARSVIYAPTVTAGFIALLIKDYAIGEELPREVLLDLPSFTLL